MTILSDRPIDARSRAIPTVPLALGAAGLLPFVGLAALMAWLRVVDTGLDPAWRGLAGGVIVGYGAVILSFLGGVRWGVAAGEPGTRERTWLFAGSVLPSLAAWPALFVPASLALAGLALAHLALGAADARLARSGRAPPWYGRLRIGLALVAAASLLVALASL